MSSLPRFPLSFPPRGLFLVLLCSLFLLPGLTGHDPWKGDDATHIGVIYGFATGTDWLVPRLAGQLYLDNPPLYYWVGALSTRTLAFLLPLHDAARLASGLFVALMLLFLGLAARRLNDPAAGCIAPLIAIGSLGLFLHSHETQPLTALLAASAATYYGLALIRSHPVRGGAVAGAAIGLGFLACGLIAPASLLPLVLLLPLASREWPAGAWGRGLLALLLVALPLCALWPALLGWRSEQLLAAWWSRELADFRLATDWGLRLRRYLSMLPWFAWPALPLALWTLWRERHNLGRAGVALPLLAFVVSLAMLFAFFPSRSLTALPVLPSLALLAVPAAGSLRRGAANAFDWFGMMSFTFFAGLIWLGWVAMVFGVPPRIARNFAKLEPGFVAQFSWPAFAAALALTLAWLWLIVTSPRSPFRGTVHWAAGVTLLWCLIIALWLPWIDYGRSYRGVAESLARSLPKNPGCVIGKNLGESQRASFHYFIGLVTVPEGSRAAGKCDYFLIQGTARQEVPPGAGWRKIREEHRPGDKVERYRLYRKE